MMDFLVNFLYVIDDPEVSDGFHYQDHDVLRPPILERHE